MAHWADGRAGGSAGGEQEHIARAAAVARVEDALRALKRDDLFQMDLKDPAVLCAINHWTGRKRLPAEQANRLMSDNYRIRAVLERIRRLQSVCREAGIGVPIDRVLKGQETLGGTNSSKTEASLQQKQQGEASKAGHVSDNVSSQARQKKETGTEQQNEGDGVDSESQTAVPNVWAEAKSAFVRAVVMAVLMAVYMQWFAPSGGRVASGETGSGAGGDRDGGGL